MCREERDTGNHDRGCGGIGGVVEAVGEDYRYPRFDRSSGMIAASPASVTARRAAADAVKNR